jgi:hypothetical protein
MSVSCALTYLCTGMYAYNACRIYIIIGKYELSRRTHDFLS